jgi:putative protease
VTVHHHIPTFHTEHCVYAHTLSRGRDFRTCGRPCEEHRVALRDPKGLEHPVVVDVGCRNTVFNATAQAAPGEVPGLLRRGVRRFRVELVWETRAEAELVLRTWQAVLRGEGQGALARLGVVERFGVSGGTMEVVS